jgi:WD40 repeat protein
MILMNDHIINATTTIIAFLHDGLLASGSGSWSFDHTVRVWDAATGECKQTLTGHTAAVNIVVSLGNRLLALESVDSTARVWDLAKGEHKEPLSSHSGRLQ